MNKFVHFMKVLGLCLVAGLAGGILHLGLSYFLTAPQMGYIFVGISAAAFYQYVIKEYNKKLWDIPFEVFGVVLAVVITQFFDIMIFGATKIVGEREEIGILYKMRLIYKKGYYSIADSTGGFLSNENIYLELVFLIIFALIAGAITAFILHCIETGNDNGKKKHVHKKKK